MKFRWGGDLGVVLNRLPHVPKELLQDFETWKTCEAMAPWTTEYSSAHADPFGPTQDTKIIWILVYFPGRLQFNSAINSKTPYMFAWQFEPNPRFFPDRFG